jgi:formate-dependent nitrite reductase membrane component NrfD
MSHALMWKHWSPMSVGAWALLIFGICSFLSFLGSLWPAGRFAQFLRHGWFGKILQLIGCSVGFFIASYTGALVTATNQPLWSDSVWIAPLFLTSATSTGLATMILLAHNRPGVFPGLLARVQHAEIWALLLELAVFVTFLISLGGLLLPVLQTWHGKLLVIGTLLLGLLFPLVLHARVGLSPQRSMLLAAACSLLGGFVLRYAMLTTPPELLALAPAVRVHYAIEESQGIGTPGPALLPRFSPEDERPRGGPGADIGNKTADLEPRSKVFDVP